MSMSKKEEYERLRGLINQWNVDHYDIFELSQPNEDLEFHGVVRFFFQGGIGANVITKCIRVSSTATTKEVIGVLIEKFRPDMRMLSQSKYALYEVHVNGEERRLGNEEKPLYVQLNWGNDVREGRFLLRNEDHPTVRDPALGFDNSVLQQDQAGFKRKLSKREKKEKKKKDRGKENVNGDESVANKLYEEAPETSFTRSISNPEAVMRRRRQQKLEKKLAQMNAVEGGTDSGGTLKIYGESLQREVPYKTLFLSTADPASAVVKEALEKYGREKEDPNNYCLVEVLLPPGGVEYHGGSVGDERVLDDNECPLAIVMQHTKHRGQGHIIFQLRERSADYKKRSKRPRAVSQDDLRNHQSDHRHTNVDMLPYLTELNVRGKPKRHVLPLNVTEVVNASEVANNRQDYNGKHFLQLSGPDIRPRHCVIAHTEGIVTVTPNSQDAETYVERQRIFETTMLKHGMTVQFGKDKIYRFLDPRFDEPPMHSQPYQLPNKAQRGQPQETNFDVDGNIETVEVTSPAQRPTSWDSQQRRSNSDRSPGSSQGTYSTDDLLPASVEYFMDAEDRLLQGSILEVNSKQLQFKLAPTYTLYMAVRNLLSARSPVTHRSQLVADFANKTARMTQQSIQEHHNDPSALAFWMANSSEILHMFKQDRDIHSLSFVAQEMLAEAVQTAFHHLVSCLQGDLQRVMPAFLDPSDNTDAEDEMGHRYNMGRPTLTDVLNTLSVAMTLLRRCRVNAALTIQLFSQLFHFINMWLFNILVTEPQLQLCTRMWGIRLKRRLGSVEAWAEKQGLELAADCHLCRIIQAAHLLQTPKFSADDVTNISSTCFKLNSLQLHALLTRYIPEPNEPPVSASFIDRVVSIAENMADELTRTDGREVRLEEDNDLHLPFLLPEDGYSCDTIRGIPNGLPDFVRQLESQGICRFIINNNASGSWTVYMGDEPPSPNLKLNGPSSPGHGLPPTPEIINVTFSKVKGSMGLSIVAAHGEGQKEQGIYIKSVVEGGAAAQDGRLQAGDQLLEVDGKSLIGLSQDKAAELMTKTGQVIKLKVAKRAVLYHNLGSLLSQPSPTSQRAAQNKNFGPNRLASDEGPPPYDGRDSKAVNGYGDQSKMRAPSTSNIANPKPLQNDPYNYRNDPRSKSTSNLHVDTNLARQDMYQQIKPAQSVGVLHPSSPGYGQYSPGGRRQDIRPNDYENQPNYTRPGGTGDRNSYDTRQGYNFVDPRQNIPGQPKPQNQGYTGQKNSDRSSISSKASSNSNKDPRPQSAYYDPHKTNSRDNGEYPTERPKSDDVGSKLKEWQDKFEPPRPDYNKMNSGGNSPPYSNIGGQPPPQPQHNPPPKPTAHERLFSQQAMPPKPNNSSYVRQNDFYENTVPLKQEPPPAFHQLQNISMESDLKPRPGSKPPQIVQKNKPSVQHTDLPMVRVDNRQTQLRFYGDNRLSGQPTSPQGSQQPGFMAPNVPKYDQRNVQPSIRNSGQQEYSNDPRYLQQDLRTSPDPRNDPRNGPEFDYRGMQQDPRNVPDLRYNSDPRNVQPLFPLPNDVRNSVSSYQDQNRLPEAHYQQKYPESVNHYGAYPTDPNEGLPLPAVPQAIEDYQEELPPLPPPPSNEILLEQKLAEEQQKLMQHINATNQFLADRHHKYPNQPQPQQQSQYQQQQPYQPPPQQQQYQPPPQQRSQPMNRVLPPGLDLRDQNPLGYQVVKDGYRPNDPLSHPNYQNINYGTESQPPPIPQPPSEYDSIDNPALRVQGFQVKPAVPPSKPKLKDRLDLNTRSAWDRDAKEKAQEEEQEELFRAREQEIAELEARPFLNPSDQDRLKKLKTEHEFQRRVREIAEKGDYDYEDDDEMAERIYTRERIIQTLKEDLEKSRARLQDFELAQQRADVERESERLKSLERRLEMHEKDREEQRLRMQKKQERRAKEHQEQLKLQRETRERQRQNYEEQKRLLQKEEEKINQRREEELNKKRQFERERRQEIQDKQDAEEKRIRAEIRREEEEYLQQQLAQERQMKQQQNRPIRVGDERKRLESLNSQSTTGPQSPTSNYAQYANVNSQGQSDPSQAPPPPTRSASSYETFNQHQLRASFRASSSAEFPPPSALNNSNTNSTTGLPSALKSSQEPPPTAKKSVSFNTQMNTYKDRTPSNSVSSYKSPTGSQTFEDLPPPSFSPDTDVFDTPIPPLLRNNNPMPNDRQSDVVYNTSSNTPNVIGAQEVYRDPRSRIEAKKASQSTVRSQSTDRMSFREKMKYFATEAGEDTIKLKPKASKTLRTIESQLNGQIQ
ncbi:afadin [Biomphalaria pfeifferi]|uniref:Afadin n=1 Tax=Biomphalaria pfeifferi TaxID=112525 RepID=A0AAD8C0X6_BIOPF|nr:afadin [Biomphalaria pfeifferi]